MPRERENGSPVEGRPERRAATSRDVAQLAGVSQSVVSRALSGSPSVAPATRALVEQAAATLGYRRNLLARTLITRRSRVIALVTGEMRNLFFVDALHAVAAAVRRRGYQLFWQSSPSGAGIDDAVRTVLQYQADGILIAGGPPGEAAMAACRAQQVPLILLYRQVAPALTSSVSSDNAASARAIAELLHGLGHRRFAVVSGADRGVTYNVVRVQAFAERVVELGHAPPEHRVGNDRYDNGRAAGRELLDGPAPVDAVFCTNDIMAFGIIDAARALGLRPGRDVSIIGYDDTEPSGWAGYGLSTVRQDLEGIADAACDILLAEVEDPSLAPTTHLVPVELVLRTTTRPRAAENGSARDDLARDGPSRPDVGAIAASTQR